MGADRADTAVLPSHRGRGIGTWLAHWLQRRSGAQRRLHGRRHARARRARPATGCWRRSASGSGGPAGCSRCPRARPSRRATCPRATSIRTGRARRRCALPTTSWRTRSSSGRSASARRSRTSPAATSRPARASSRGTSASPSTPTVTSSASRWSSSPTTGRRRTSTASPYASDQRNRGLAQALLVDSFAATREHGTTHVRAQHRLTHRSTRPLRARRHDGETRCGSIAGSTSS